ncbi:hypothetical protein [Bradyrhizobium sp.]|uniref:hypothetical protein n=1 Tax=Bradyrhizobium sp. TaxID=376 RepID=UPI0025BD3240|nr:hypothetical protein [Bradyrhizobium sp.]MBV8921447.1 hypothetical protein [Bradyrhizobium sp.]
MSGHLRFCLAAFLFAGLSMSPACSYPFDALFSSAPAEATASAPAEEECLPQPGKSTADGQHWVYRFDGHRRCWFQAAEEIATVKKPVSHHAAKKHVAAPRENETALRKRKAVVDARELLLRSAQAETPQPTPPAPEIKVVDVAPDPTTGAAALVPPAPAIAKPAIDQLTSNHPAPRQVDVEALLAAAPPASSDAVATSVPSPARAAIPITEAGDEGREWTVSWLGTLLIGLGLVSLLGASQTRRARCWSGDFSTGGRSSRPSPTTESGTVFCLQSEFRSIGRRRRKGSLGRPAI